MVEGRTRLARGVWVEPGVSEGLEERCAALSAACGPDSVIAGRTAAQLHGMWMPPAPVAVEVATVSAGIPSREMSRTRRPEVIASRRTLGPSDVVGHGRLLVTTPARTWVDLARVLSLPDLVSAGDSVLRAGTTADELDRALAASAGARGIRRARHARVLLNPASRSRPETHLRLAVADGGLLPEFDVNEPIYRRAGGWLAEPDLSLPGARIALEYQGVDHANPDRMRRDITRAADLRREGWLCIYYGPAQVFGRPWEIAGELLDIVRARAPHLIPRSPRRVVSPPSSGQLQVSTRRDTDHSARSSGAHRR